MDEDRSGQTRLDRARLDETNFRDRMGQYMTGPDRTGQDQTGRDRTGHEWTGQASTGHDRTRQGRTGQDRPGQDRTGQDRTRQDRTGQGQNLGQGPTSAAGSEASWHVEWYGHTSVAQAGLTIDEA